jgi:hypothetical protein
MIERIDKSNLPAHIKACIALTSWKQRINTVGITIFNLMRICGNEYHIVLTLAEEEFPNKMRDLPPDLILMNQVGIFEILWVKHNWKSFKKWIFCSMRYSQVPIISADDDMIYTINYADILYKSYCDNPDSVISYTKSHSNPPNPCGLASLYPPSLFPLFIDGLANYTITHNQDDRLLLEICKRNNIQIIGLYDYYPGYFHDETEPINGSYNNAAWVRKQRY